MKKIPKNNRIVCPKISAKSSTLLLLWSHSWQISNSIPLFNKVIGIAMINKPYFLSKDKFDIIIDSKKYTGEICDIPFV